MIQALELLFAPLNLDPSAKLNLIVQLGGVAIEDASHVQFAESRNIQLSTAWLVGEILDLPNQRFIVKSAVEVQSLEFRGKAAAEVAIAGCLAHVCFRENGENYHSAQVRAPEVTSCAISGNGCYAGNSTSETVTIGCPSHVLGLPMIAHSIPKISPCMLSSEDWHAVLRAKPEYNPDRIVNDHNYVKWAMEVLVPDLHDELVSNWLPVKEKAKNLVQHWNSTLGG